MITFFFFFKDKEKDTLQNVLEGRDEYGAGGEQRRESQGKLSLTVSLCSLKTGMQIITRHVNGTKDDLQS